MITHEMKVATRIATKKAIKAGLIKRAPCEVCGDTKAQEHHDDYTDHMKIRWLCHRHHVEWHATHLDLESDGRRAKREKCTACGFPIITKEQRAAAVLRQQMRRLRHQPPAKDK